MLSTDPRPITLTAHGVSLRLRAVDAPLLDGLISRAAALGWIDVEGSGVDLDYSIIDGEHGRDLICNGETLCSTTDRAALVDAFEDHAKIELAWRAPHHLFVHAGVVGWRGGAIVIPGRSRTGKTTLVEALVRAGADYYSDEFALLDASGCVHPYAIPLGVRGPEGRRAIAVDAIGGRSGTDPLPVATIVLTEYHARARWRPRAVSPGLAMLALMDNTVAARQSPERTMPILRRAVEAATVVRSRRGDAAATAQILLAHVP